MATSSDNSSRAHIRLHFTDGVQAELRLINKAGRQLTSSTTTVLMQNISQNGLCFISNLQLPIQPNYLVELRMSISNVQLIVRGRILWQSLTGDQFVHGVLFICSDAMRSLIIGVMNHELLVRQPQQQKIHHLYNRPIHTKRIYNSG
ncbi:hypothetical protein FHS15_003479 [Paenibacillus castaneae]|uniref:PilZ domain-containing protein n=1 Tax=Paenibacillus castaneae TaxID=474957 RepID=UPI000C9D2282|nr:PilZ domain-containing protein [Paenibacillus castaneae]NIK78341.1 hypothetical protein [Paenibacillus castaneae]